MPELRRDRVFRQRLTIAAILAATVGVTGTALILWRGMGLNYAITALVVAMLGWGIWASIALIRYRCPRCQQRIGWFLPGPDDPPGEAIAFYCARCDVRWDTGISRPGD